MVRLMFIRWLMFALLGSLLFTFTAWAQEDEEMQTFILNNSTFVLYHEIGHLLIGELGIPVLAKEEDAADNLAALLLLAGETPESENALRDSAAGWFLSDSLDTAEVYDDSQFYDSHSLDVQRAYQVICLMVGAAPEVFADSATEAEMDEDRQEECVESYEQAASSWEAVLEPHYAEEGAVVADITISYGDTSTYPQVKQTFEEGRFLETAAEEVISAYALPRPITLRTADCDEPNAYYDPEVGEVVFCYNMSDYFAELYASWEDDTE